MPITLGVLTTLTEDQAAERAAEGPGNKGREAALAAVLQRFCANAIVPQYEAFYRDILETS